MKKKLIMKCFIFISLFFVMTINTFAVCSDEEKNKLSEQANSIVTLIELNKVDGVGDESSYAETYPSFVISFFNMNENMYLRRQSTGQIYNKNDMAEGRISFYYRDLRGNNETYEVYSDSSTCSGELLRSIDLFVPQYNELSNNPICEEIPDFMYCKPTFSSIINLTYEEFIEKANEYKANLEAEEEQQNNDNILVTIISKYWYLLIVIAVVIVGVIYIIKKIKKNKEINKRGIV